MVASILRTFLLVNVALLASAAVLPRLAPGAQFITGPCTSDVDCESSCCGFNSGKCAGPVIAQERDGGCGFGDAQPNNNAAQKVQGAGAEAAPAVKAANNAGSGGAAVAAAVAPAATSAAKAPGTQFITGACSSDVDCASSCCGFNSGKCAGPVIAQERDGGCGHGDAQPNNIAAQKIQGPSAQVATGVQAAGAPADNAASGGAAVSAAPAPAPTSAAKAPGTQFITGACSSDADCASSCCGFKSGKCAGPVIAQERDGGCGFGDAQPNNVAAQKIQGAGAQAAPGIAGAEASAPAPVAAATTATAAAAAGTQFITGACADDGACASGCCSVGKCAARLVATGPGGKGCGFTSARRGLRFLADLA